MRSLAQIFICGTLILGTPSYGQQAATPLDQQIRTEANARSEVMEDAFYLSEVYGPRFNGSPNLTAASQWLSDRLKRYGLSHVHTEDVARPIDVGGGLLWSGSGWAVAKFSIEMAAPTYSALLGEPLMFSTSTPGSVTGKAVAVSLPGPGNREALRTFMADFKGKLFGKILLNSTFQTVQRPSASDMQKYSPAQLEELGKAQDAVPPVRKDLLPTEPVARNPAMQSMLADQDQLFAFLKREGVVAIIQAAPGGGGTHFVTAPFGLPDPSVPPPPTVALEPEQYNRVLRLVQHDIPVDLTMDVQTVSYPKVGPFNLLADIPGSRNPRDVVMVGAHLDSFHLAEGATDNAANVAVLLEAARILHTLNQPMKRTIRFAFWGGEEEDRQGSKDYVRKHILRSDDSGDTINCYFNLDYGAGAIRGIYLQGHANLAPAFRHWLTPFADVNSTTVSLKVTEGSDQKSFNDAGTAGFSFIQDPLDYESRTHHTNMDTYDYLQADDLKQSAAILAELLFDVANADDSLSALMPDPHSKP